MGTGDLQDMVLSKCDIPVDSAVGNVLEQWMIAHGSPVLFLDPVGPSSTKQHEWHKLSVTFFSYTVRRFAVVL